MRNKRTVKQKQIVPDFPDLEEEKALLSQGYRLVAGIDEVGRGALAGPVAAAALILPLRLNEKWISEVRDSKQLTAKKRQFLADHLKEKAVAFGIGMVSHNDIDRKGIMWSTRQAMRIAILHLEPAPEYLLIDALALPSVKLPQKHIIKGDARCLSIACASIVAKVARDELMVELDQDHPGYGFADNKGYGTAKHLASLDKLGACPIHRRSFSPVKEVCI